MAVFSSISPHIFNQNEVIIDRRTGATLDGVKASSAKKVFGVFPWRLVGFQRQKLRTSDEFDNSIQDLLEQEYKITNPDYNRLVTFQSVKQLRRLFATDANRSTHLGNVRVLFESLFFRIAEYRNFVFTREATDDTYSRHHYRHRNDKDRYYFGQNFGSMQEPFVYDLLQYYFQITQQDISLHAAPWYADVHLGIDLMLNGIPIDLTTQHAPHEKIAKLHGRRIAVIKPRTSFESACSTLLRETLLYTPFLFKPTERIFGRDETPAEVFYKDICLVHQAVTEIITDTETTILPLLKGNDEPYNATVNVLEMLNGIQR